MKRKTDSTTDSAQHNRRLSRPTPTGATGMEMSSLSIQSMTPPRSRSLDSSLVLDLGEKALKKGCKRVSFCSVEPALVIPVPSCDDLSDIRGFIWYTRLHYSQFRYDAIEEMKVFMSEHSLSNTEAAMVYMYQPNALPVALEKNTASHL